MRRRRFGLGLRPTEPALGVSYSKKTNTTNPRWVYSGDGSLHLGAGYEFTVAFHNFVSGRFVGLTF
jgi:hypothetical protein